MKVKRDIIIQKKNKFNARIDKTVNEKILNVSITRNNFLYNVQLDGLFIISPVSSGSLGLRGSEKGSTVGIKSIIKYMCKKIVELSIFRIFLKFSGLPRWKRTILRNCRRSKIFIVGWEDLTPIPHNGCRLCKKKRK